MEKIIIENRTKLPMAEILPYIRQVISDGRISNFGKNYCYLTTWPDGIRVSADKNKKSDKFMVWQGKKESQQK
jgi:hypothetical protein